MFKVTQADGEVVSLEMPKSADELANTLAIASHALGKESYLAKLMMMAAIELQKCGQVR